MVNSRTHIWRPAREEKLEGTIAESSLPNSDMALISFLKRAEAKEFKLAASDIETILNYKSFYILTADSVDQQLRELIHADSYFLSWIKSQVKHLAEKATEDFNNFLSHKSYSLLDLCNYLTEVNQNEIQIQSRRSIDYEIDETKAKLASKNKEVIAALKSCRHIEADIKRKRTYLRFIETGSKLLRLNFSNRIQRSRTKINEQHLKLKGKQQEVAGFQQDINKIESELSQQEKIVQERNGLKARNEKIKSTLLKYAFESPKRLFFQNVCEFTMDVIGRIDAKRREGRRLSETLGEVSDAIQGYDPTEDLYGSKTRKIENLISKCNRALKSFAAGLELNEVTKVHMKIDFKEFFRETKLTERKNNNASRGIRNSGIHRDRRTSTRNEVHHRYSSNGHRGKNMLNKAIMLVNSIMDSLESEGKKFQLLRIDALNQIETLESGWLAILLHSKEQDLCFPWYLSGLSSDGLSAVKRTLDKPRVEILTESTKPDPQIINSIALRDIFLSLETNKTQLIGNF